MDPEPAGGREPSSAPHAPADADESPGELCGIPLTGGGAASGPATSGVLVVVCLACGGAVAVPTNTRRPEGVGHALQMAGDPERLITVIGELAAPVDLEGALVGPHRGSHDSDALDEDPPEWHGLSPRLRQVVRLLAEGLSDRQIAGRLQVTPRTARDYTSQVLTKLGLHSRRELMSPAHRHLPVGICR